MHLVASSIPVLGWDGVAWRLLVAAGLAGLIGLERELDEKAAGLRTHMLVSLGSALFTLISAYGFSEFLNGNAAIRADPGRIAAQVVTGIGFIGAGVIFRQGFNVRGLTTAASLWFAAAAGMASGAGYWRGAVLATAIALFSLRPLEWLKERMLPRRRHNRLVVELEEHGSAGEVIDALERVARVLALRKDGQELEVDLAVHESQRSLALAEVGELEGVREVRWSQ
jgi:putative Mg2+ transporter-C (MgtC) family protein